MDIAILKRRANWEKNFSQLVTALNRRKKRRKDIKDLEDHAKIVFQKIEKSGGFLTAKEKQILRKTENCGHEDCKENLLSF